MKNIFYKITLATLVAGAVRRHILFRRAGPYPE